MLQECIAEASKDAATDEYTIRRLRELAGFFDTTSAWYEQVRAWPVTAIAKFVKAREQIRKILGLGGK